MKIRALTALVVFGAGLAVLAVAQIVTPGRGLPLYDGVVVEDPYRYSNPGPGQEGAPSAAQNELIVTGDSSPAVVIVTDETPPQAQLILAAGALAMPQGTTKLTGSATPLAPTSDQANGAPLSNVYQLQVVDQDGNDVPLAAGQQATVILRSPSLHLSASMSRWDGTTWQMLPTTTSNQADLLKSQVTTLGEFALLPGQALVEPGALFIAGVAILIVAFLGGALLLGRRRSSAAEAGTSRGTTPNAKPTAPGRRPGKSRRKPDR